MWITDFFFFFYMKVCNRKANDMFHWRNVSTFSIIFIFFVVYLSMCKWWRLLNEEQWNKWLWIIQENELKLFSVCWGEDVGDNPFVSLYWVPLRKKPFNCILKDKLQTTFFCLFCKCFLRWNGFPIHILPSLPKSSEPIFCYSM